MGFVYKKRGETFNDLHPVLGNVYSVRRKIPPNIKLIVERPNRAIAPYSFSDSGLEIFFNCLNPHLNRNNPMIIQIMPINLITMIPP